MQKKVIRTIRHVLIKTISYQENFAISFSNYKYQKKNFGKILFDILNAGVRCMFVNVRNFFFKMFLTFE